MERLEYSVLMSVYHKEKPEYLIEAIESMLNQTVQADQFVIVEDGLLTNKLEQVICKYEKENSQLFTIVRLNENRGLGQALDEGLKYCRNELVARMDSDDVSMLDRCEKQLAVFEMRPELDIISGSINEFKNSIDNVLSVRRVPETEEAIRRQMRRRSAFNHPAVMFKKSTVIQVGGYGKSTRKEDHDLFSRMVFGGCKAYNLQEPILYYRINEDNMKRKKSWKNVRSYIEIMWINFRRGYCGCVDFMFVITAQIFYLVVPVCLLEKILTFFYRE